MEELKKFQSSTFDTIARRRLVKDQDTILELTGKIQDLQNEINCMNDSKDFQDAESIRSGNSHVTSRPVSFPPHPVPEGMLSCSIGMPSRREGPPSIWDTHGISGNVFASPTASSSAPYPQESNPWISNESEYTSPHVMSESQTQVQDQRCHSASMEFISRRAAPFVHSPSTTPMTTCTPRVSKQRCGSLEPEPEWCGSQSEWKRASCFEAGLFQRGSKEV